MPRRNYVVTDINENFIMRDTLDGVSDFLSMDPASVRSVVADERKTKNGFYVFHVADWLNYHEDDKLNRLIDYAEEQIEIMSKEEATECKQMVVGMKILLGRAKLISEGKK